MKTLALMFFQPSRTQAQVSTFPYGPYNSTNAARLADTTGGDGNYCAHTNTMKGQVVTNDDEDGNDQDDLYPAPWKMGWRVSKRHGESDSPCARLTSLRKVGAEAYLDLKVNSRAIEGSDAHP